MKPRPMNIDYLDPMVSEDGIHLRFCCDRYSVSGQLKATNVDDAIRAVSVSGSGKCVWSIRPARAPKKSGK